jgi:hypothetical protein
MIHAMRTLWRPVVSFRRIALLAALLMLPLPASAQDTLPENKGFVTIMRIIGTSGFTSAALFLAAGVVGTGHFFSLMEQGHAYAESIGFEEGGPEAVRSAEIMWGLENILGLP